MSVARAIVSADLGGSSNYSRGELEGRVEKGFVGTANGGE